MEPSWFNPLPATAGGLLSYLSHLLHARSGAGAGAGAGVASLPFYCGFTGIPTSVASFAALLNFCGTSTTGIILFVGVTDDQVGHYVGFIKVDEAAWLYFDPDTGVKDVNPQSTEFLSIMTLNRFVFRFSGPPPADVTSYIPCSSTHADV